MNITLTREHLAPRKSGYVLKITRSNGHPTLLYLSRSEALILDALIQSQQTGGLTVRELGGVLGYAQTARTHTGATHVYRIRKKLQALDPSLENLIITKGEKYILSVL